MDCTKTHADEKRRMSAEKCQYDIQMKETES